MANKLDDLFRETLDQHEITPSGASWGKIQSNLAKNKSAKWLSPVKIAAAVALVIVASVLLFNPGSSERGGFIAEVNHPVERNTLEWNFNIPEKQDQINTTGHSSLATTQPAATADKKKEVETAPGLRDTYTLATITQYQLHPDHAPMNLPTPKPDPELQQPAIRITYIAATEQDSENPETRLSRVLSMAREVSPTDLLADLRDVKDNFFKRN